MSPVPTRVEDCVSREEWHELLTSLREIREEQRRQGQILAQYAGAVKLLVWIGATITAVVAAIGVYVK